jgi:hypothetical protein
MIMLSPVEVIYESCFSECRSLSSITFESDSHLQRIGKSAFHSNGLALIISPSSIEVSYESCFSECKSLSSPTFKFFSQFV